MNSRNSNNVNTSVSLGENKPQVAKQTINMKELKVTSPQKRRTVLTALN
tara:strand:+ start:332 stop:478 length:147 start_codon:yes stop_codon:yes gene_type:complete